MSRVQSLSGEDQVTPNLQDAHDLMATFANRGLSFQLRNNRLWLLPAKSFGLLSDEERAAIGRLRQQLKAIVRDGLQPAPVVQQPQPEAPQEPTPVREAQRKAEPTPEVWAYGVRITEAHVTTALTALGDHMLAAYASGRLTKLEAYDIARRRERQAQELLGRYYRR